MHRVRGLTISCDHCDRRAQYRHETKGAWIVVRWVCWEHQHKLAVREQRCVSDPASHAPHVWTYAGELVSCHGRSDVATMRRLAAREARYGVSEGPCCADPLCGCSYKPGWGDGNAVHTVERVEPVDVDAEHVEGWS